MYIAVSFLLAIVFQIVLGGFLSIEYIVSIALVTIGASWSYLSLEINQVNQLRNEYVKELNDFEASVHDFLKMSFEVFMGMISCENAISMRAGKEGDKYFESLSKKNLELKNNFDIMNYRMDKLGRHSNKINVSALRLKTSEIYSYMVKDNRRVAAGEETEISKKTKVYSDDARLVMYVLMEDFSNGMISFEGFSVDFKNKKNVCVAIVFFSVFIVLIKGLMSLV